MLDIRIPIGLMFGIFGVLLTIFGFVSDTEIYKKSLGINVNLWMGILMFVFGVVMLYFTRKKKKSNK